MIYMGSKNRLSKELIPIIQSYITDETYAYIEPFVGGGNVIDKITCNTKIGCDIDKYVIAVLNGLKDGVEPPYEVTREEYMDIKNNKDKYSDFLVGYIGYELSFGAKWFGGYVKRDDKKKRGDVYSYRHCMKQSENLINTTFKCCNYKQLNDLHNCVIYCDPPYKNTTKYKTDFDHNEFYDWCREMSKENIVLISEYDMPKDFTCLWQKETKVTLSSQRASNDDKDKRIEKLYICTDKTN